MRRRNDQLILRKDDYDVLLSYVRGQRYAAFDRQNAELLQEELKKAKLVNSDDFPHDTIRLNSKVRIKEEEKSKEMEVILVLPENADIREKKISIMAPLGTALIGFRKGQKVKWHVPSGDKTFTIMDVINENA